MPCELKAASWVKDGGRAGLDQVREAFQRLLPKGQKLRKRGA